jgi:hypothetical protein
MMDKSIGKFFQLLIQEFPHLLYMFLSRANVANRKAQGEFVIEFRVRQKSLTGSVDPVHDCFVKSIQAFRARFLNLYVE